MKRAWLLGLILAAPALGIIVAEGLRASFNSDLREAVRARFAEKHPGAAVSLGHITVDLYCERVGAEAGGDLCTTVGYLRLMRRVSIGAAALGLLLLGLIYLGGRVSRRRREVLASLFVPGLRGTIAVVLLLVVAHAGVLIGAIYYGEAALFKRVHIWLIGGVALGALAAVFAVARASFRIVRRAEMSVQGISVEREAHPRLWARVDEIADRLGALRPTHLVLGLEPNFFVTEAEVLTQRYRHSGRTLYCSVPLLRILTPEELDSILAHELGHFVGGDVAYSRRFYPVYRGTAEAMDALTSSTEGISGRLPVLPAVAVLAYFFQCFEQAVNEIGRDRELAADRRGAEVAGAAATATALVKVHAFAGLWYTMQRGTVDLLERRTAPPNASLAFAAEASRSADATALGDLTESRLVHPTDTHPPLTIRLESLETTLEAVSERALLVAPTPSASELVSDLEALEEELTAELHQALAYAHGIDLEEETTAEAVEKPPAATAEESTPSA